MFVLPAAKQTLFLLYLSVKINIKQHILHVNVLHCCFKKNVALQVIVVCCNVMHFYYTY